MVNIGTPSCIQTFRELPTSNEMQIKIHDARYPGTRKAQRPAFRVGHSHSVRTHSSEMPNLERWIWVVPLGPWVCYNFCWGYPLSVFQYRAHDSLGMHMIRICIRHNCLFMMIVSPGADRACLGMFNFTQPQLELRSSSNM